MHHYQKKDDSLRCYNQNRCFQNYWKLRGRDTVKKLMKRCVKCKRIEGLFFRIMPVHILPDIRVDEGPPFVNTEIYFIGPLFVARSTTKEEFKTYI